MLTRLMLASPSIWPPERKNTSIRPWPAQSNNSRPPSVKKSWLRLSRIDKYARPPPRTLASTAAAAGIGDCAPTATWRASPISRLMTSAMSSSVRNSPSGGAPVMDVTIEIGGKSFRTRREPGIFGEMRVVALVTARQRQRPRPARNNRDLLDIEARKRSGRERRILQQVLLVEPLDRDHGRACRMRHGHELAGRPDPDIAVRIRHGSMEQRDVGFDRRQQHDRVVVGERVVDDAP